jgi:hypothetical protein
VEYSAAGDAHDSVADQKGALLSGGVRTMVVPAPIAALRSDGAGSVVEFTLAPKRLGASSTVPAPPCCARRIAVSRGPAFNLRADEHNPAVETNALTAVARHSRHAMNSSAEGKAARFDRSQARSRRSPGCVCAASSSPATRSTSLPDGCLSLVPRRARTRRMAAVSTAEGRRSVP